jgi:hypothetical protein
MTVEHFKEKSKESFCAPCAAPALAAVVGAGGTLALAKSKFSIILCGIGAAVAFLFMFRLIMKTFPTRGPKKK